MTGFFGVFDDSFWEGVKFVFVYGIVKITLGY